ncbi:MAG: hypothetical protein MI974_21590 [Chitinophagales bacterium]|nr:hypothetical protein [Chitinophagales bacterium]
MKHLLYFILVLALAAIIQLFLPWWSMPLLAIILAYILKVKPAAAFLGGFLAAIFLWGGYAFYLNMANESIMANRIGQLFGGLGGNTMVIIAAVFGGLFTGLAGLVGSQCRYL